MAILVKLDSKQNCGPHFLPYLHFYGIYISTANHDLGEVQIRDMLEDSRDSNREKNITGCLLHYQGKFLHYLERNQVQVLQLFDMIKEDDRHSRVGLLSHGDMTEREFGRYPWPTRISVGPGTERNSWAF